MDTETVNSVGFVVYQLLGLVGGLILCYFGYRLLMRRPKVRPSETRGTWNSAKRFIKNAAPGTLFALIGAAAIWLTASNALTPKTFGSKNSVDGPVLPAKEAVTTNPAENDGANATTPEAPTPGDQVHPGNVAENNPPIGQSPTPAPAPTSETGTQADRDALTQKTQGREVEPQAPVAKTVESESQKAGRKSLEKDRRAAERKRSRLEKMYQNHLISGEAYKKGEEQYKSEIEKYRNAINAGVAE